MSSVTRVPEGFATVNLYLVVPRATEALDFYARAFGAEPGLRMEGPGGATIHSEMRLGDSVVMLTDENPQWNARSPSSLGGSPASIHLYVEDADAMFARAVAAGCEVERPMEDVFWGDRYGKVKDPFGYSWGIAHQREVLSESELAQRQQEWFRTMASTQTAS
jgi:PhnB protein